MILVDFHSKTVASRFKTLGSKEYCPVETTELAKKNYIHHDDF